MIKQLANYRGYEILETEDVLKGRIYFYQGIRKVFYHPKDRKMFWKNIIKYFNKILGTRNGKSTKYITTTTRSKPKNTGPVARKKTKITKGVKASKDENKKRDN